MAKAGFIMHGARGKVANNVFSKGENGTIQRELVKPRNPKTLRQAKQRCAFAMATSAAKGLRFIVNHSFQGINTEKENIREFIRINSKLLRAQIETSLAGGNAVKGNLQIKGARGMQAANYIISRGSVFFPAFSQAAAEHGVGVKYIAQSETPADLSATITTQEQYEAALAVLGFKPGDQCSVVAICGFPTTIATYLTENNYLTQAIGARVTFATTIPEGFSGTLLDENSHVNAQLIEEKLGNMEFIMTPAAGDDPAFIHVVLSASDVPTGAIVDAVGIVRSVKDINGQFTYSPCQLLWLGEGIDDLTVVQSYMQAAAGDTESDYFLDQPVYSGNA